MTSAAAELDLRGGHPVIDFVNTVAWRGEPGRRVDYLAHYSDPSSGGLARVIPRWSAPMYTEAVPE